MSAVDASVLGPWAEDDAAIAALARMREVHPDADPVAHIPDVHPARVPRHIAFIMDGNGRWAEQRGFPRLFGHRNGASAVRETVIASGELGIEQVTLYSFSTENWRRPSDEIKALWELCVMYCDGEREALVRENIRLRVIGRTGELPEDVRDAIDRVEEATSVCKGPTLCLALNYGSRHEIVDATRALARRVASGELSPEDIDEDAIEASLYTAGMPEPDLLVRTAGEMRLSNYLLWQLSYAEIYVTDTLWPDFGRAALHEAVRAYAARERRFGGLASVARSSGDAVGGEAEGSAC